MKKVSIVIPVYNEKNTIHSILEVVEKSFVFDLEKEIILVDDCSTDGARDILLKLKNTGKYKIYFQEKNCGKGSTLRLGFGHASGDYIIIQDADLEYDPAEYKELLTPLVEGKADVVYGSRFTGDKPHRVLFFWHYLGNKFLTMFSNIFTNLNLTDMETCYKVFTRSALQKVLPDLTANRFGIEPEITALVAKNKLRLFEVGISYSGRTYDEGKKINWKDGVSAVYTIVWSKIRFTDFFKDKYKMWLFVLLIFLSIFSIVVLHPDIRGDGVSYVQTMEVIKTGVVPSDFVPNRIITTYGGMRLVMLLNTIFHNIKISWIFMNMFMYVVAGMFFYSLSKKIFKHSVVSFLITLFLVTNYAIIIFGLNYLMDMGGWMFYIVSLYVTYKYLDSEEEKWLWISAVLIGIGGLFKEYSFMGYIPLFGSIIFLYWKDYIKILNKVFWTGFIAFGPMVIMNVYSYVAYDYTYLSWFGVQGITYVYKSRIIEYTKALGSLYNFGWFIFLGGLYYFVKELKNIRKNKNVLFVSFVILSALPVVLWGAITQRVLFIGIPATVLISGLYIEKINKKWYIIAPILTLYIICTYFMDSYILGHISLGL